jgi:hypothetical protein
MKDAELQKILEEIVDDVERINGVLTALSARVQKLAPQTFAAAQTGLIDALQETAHDYDSLRKRIGVLHKS